jgi:hypothetical protein
MRHALYLIAVVTGAWALVSFGAVMIIDGSADFWTQSLMWSLLTCAVTVPIFFISRSELPDADEPEVSKSVQEVFGEDADPFVDDANDSIEGARPEFDGSPFEDGDRKTEQERQMA